MDQELFRIALEAMWHETADAVLVVDEDGVIVGCNERVEDLLEWPVDDLVGERVEALVPHGKRGDHRAHRREYIQNPVPRRMGGDMVLFALTARGEEIPVDISLHSVRHGSSYTLTVLRDASRRHAHEEELRRLGFHDALTGLYNRHYFDEELMRVQNGREWPVVVVMADVDGLKRVNDQYGHEAGDRLIQSAADAISGAVRAGDLVARLGGDEFAAILPGMTLEDVSAICARIQEHCEETDGDSKLRISTGCARADEGDNLRAVLRSADARMYDAKARRRAERESG